MGLLDRHVAISVGLSCLLVVALGLQIPLASVAHAEPSRGVDPWPPTSPATSAMSGGIIRLQAPGSLMIRIVGGTSLLGSTELEVAEAAARCPRRQGEVEEPLNRCSEAWLSYELPRRPVTLTPYWIDRTEVTVAAYRRCVELRRCRPVPFSEGAERFDRAVLPVSLVTFEDAQNFCRQRGARLPTEAEFERAARGLASWQYPWGDTFHRGVANHGRIGWDPTDDRDGYAELAPVGSFPGGRTPAGLLDLAGNVAEWVHDHFGPYPPGPQTNPTGPPGPLAGGSSLRLVRGGSYRDPPAQLRAAARQVEDATVRSTSLGFRCVRDASARSLETSQP